MKAHLKNVEKNYGKSKEICREALVDVKLEGGLVFIFFDADCIIPKKYVSKKIKCLELYNNLKESHLKSLQVLRLKMEYFL